MSLLMEFSLERHVGKTTEELLARLVRRPKLPATSTFKSLEQAEILTTKTLKAHKYEIEMWVKNSPRGIPLRKKICMQFSTLTGIVVRRGSTQARDCYRVEIRLEMTNYNGKPYFILTSMPMK